MNDKKDTAKQQSGGRPLPTKGQVENLEAEMNCRGKNCKVWLVEQKQWPMWLEFPDQD